MLRHYLYDISTVYVSEGVKLEGKTLFGIFTIPSVSKDNCPPAPGLFFISKGYKKKLPFMELNVSPYIIYASFSFVGKYTDNVELLSTKTV